MPDTPTIETVETAPARAAGVVSGAVLVAANLIPVYGVIWLGWSTFSVVFLFWFENLIIGMFNLLKMLTVGFIGGSQEESDVPPLLRRIGLIFGACFMSIFFTFHYGMFTIVHGIFVVGMLGGGFVQNAGPETMLKESLSKIFSSELGIAAAALLISHAFSFAWNFLFKGEYRKVNVGELMAAPYGRIVVLHVAIILGAFLAMAMKSNVAVLLLLVVMKIILDLRMHMKERESGALSLFKRKSKRQDF